MENETTNRDVLRDFRAQVRTRLDAPLRTGEAHAPARLVDELAALVKVAQSGNGARVSLQELGDVIGCVGLHLRLAGSGRND